MKSYSFYRGLIIVTALVGMYIIFSDPYQMSVWRVLLNFVVFAGLCLFTYINFSNLSKEDIDKIMFNDVLKKFHLDINNED